MTVSEWADKYRVLDSSSSPIPGPWRTARTPYLKEIMDNFLDRRLKKIVLCCGTQLGKSETILNLIGYTIDQDPGPSLVVYPTDQLAKSISKNRLAAMLSNSDTLREKWNIDDSEILELQFAGMYLALVGANSPSKLASRPIRYLYFDEVDKFPARLRKDANPLDLANERTKNFANSKIIMASSPTLTSGTIWTQYLHVQVRKRYFVPCPYCGEMIQLQLAGIKWPKKLNDMPAKDRDIEVLTAAWYECPHCHSKINDMSKLDMLSAGRWMPVKLQDNEWVPDLDAASRPQSIGYNISSLYSPWLTFGQIAQKFLRSKDDAIAYMNFQNGWLAEPWTPRASSLKSDVVMAMQSKYDQGTVPRDVQLITCGIDVQQDGFYYVVRGWGPRLTSWLIDYAQVENWSDLDVLIDRPFKSETGDDLLINLCFIDSGYNAPEVYEYCALHPEVVYPSKGSSAPLRRGPITESSVEPREYGGMRLFIIDTAYYKDFIHGRLQRKPGTPGAWHVPQGITRDYANQICAEHKILERIGNRTIEKWAPVTEHAPNHYLDCEVYAAAAAERMGVRHLIEPDGR